MAALVYSDALMGDLLAAEIAAHLAIDCLHYHYTQLLVGEFVRAARTQYVLLFRFELLRTVGSLLNGPERCLGVVLLLGVYLVLACWLDFEVGLHLFLLPSGKLLADTHIREVLVLFEHI